MNEAGMKLTTQPPRVLFSEPPVTRLTRIPVVLRCNWHCTRSGFLAAWAGALSHSLHLWQIAEKATLVAGPFFFGESVARLVWWDSRYRSLRHSRHYRSKWLGVRRPQLSPVALHTAPSRIIGRFP